MKKILIILLFPLTLYPLSPKELPEKYRKWLEEEVTYIITPREKEIFLQLQTDKERELFIEAFWAVRDPTPGTPANEFKEEHYRRLEYANRYFGRETPRPGWMTDRGRVYIILGEPLDKEVHEGSADVVPTEIWFYKGNVSRGVPAFFYVVFFRREGTGEYVLYSPLKDGPESLVIDSKMRLWDRAQVLDHLREMGGQLASVSLSLIPGEAVSRDGSSIPLSSDLLLGKINDYQRRAVKDEYAEKILKYKEIVEVDYSVNYIESLSEIFISKDLKGNYFLHYLIQPKRLSLDSYQNKYFTSLKIYGRIQDITGRTIFQFEKNIPLELKEEDLKSIENRPFSVMDSFPLVSGNYLVSILVKNIVSKEFFSFEKQISVPTLSENPSLSPILLYYDRRPTSSLLIKPFTIEGYSYFPAINSVFAPSDRMGVLCRLYNLSKNSLKQTEWKVVVTGEGKEKVFNKVYSALQFHEISGRSKEKVDQIFTVELPLNELKPGNYELSISVFEKGEEILSEKREFSISPVPAVPRPWTISKPTFSIDDPFIDYTLGIQYLNTGKVDNAIAILEKAMERKPESLDFAVALSRAYFSKKVFDKVIEILTPFLNLDVKSFEPFNLLAKSYHNIGKFSQAIENYKKALNLKGLDAEILNSMGDCYIKSGERGEAIKAFEKSLEINPFQKDISDILKKLKEVKQ